MNENRACISAVFKLKIKHDKKSEFMAEIFRARANQDASKPKLIDNFKLKNDLTETVFCISSSN